MATTIKYERGGSKNQFVFWSIIGENGKRIFGSCANNRKQAEKAAKHEQRMVEAGHGFMDTYGRGTNR